MTGNNLILSDGKLELSDDLIILCGHYCINPDLKDLSSDGKVEKNTFKMGLDLYNESIKEGKKSFIYLWVNDIGIEPKERREFQTSYQLPKTYQLIMDECNVGFNQVNVLFESTMRNKASTKLRQLYKRNPELFVKVSTSEEGLLRCIDNDMCEIELSKIAYTILGPKNEKLVVKEGSNPKCNLILSTLLLTLQSKHPCAHFVNIFNGIYKNRLNLGIHVYKTLHSNSIKYENIYCDDFGNISIDTNVRA